MTNQVNTNVKVLLVEDEKIPMIVSSRILIDLGYTLDKAENGTDAVNMGKNGYDIILMDIGLPDFSGIEATKQIREYEKTTNHYTKIMALTAYSLAEIGEQCILAGMDEVANKPITKDKLQALIEKHLFIQPYI